MSFLRPENMRDASFRNKKSLRHKFLCDGGGKKRIYRGSTPVYNSSGRKNPASFNGDFRKTILAVLKKSGVPVSCSSGAFLRAQTSELSASVHISGAQTFSVTSPGHRIYNYKIEFNIS